MISLFGKPEPTLAERLKASVSKTKAALSETVDTIFLGERKIDPSILKDLETALRRGLERVTKENRPYLLDVSVEGKR